MKPELNATAINLIQYLNTIYRAEYIFNIKFPLYSLQEILLLNANFSRGITGSSAGIIKLIVVYIKGHTE